MKVTALVVAAAVAAFVWLFGSGAVFGQEAGAWATARAVVQTRVLREDVVKLTSDPEKFVATPGGRKEYLRLLERRGYVLDDQAGGAMLFRHRSGRRCAGLVLAFTAHLEVHHAPTC